ARSIPLRSGKKLTLPVVPEVTRQVMDHRVLEISEFPLTELAPGEYEIRAIFNGHFSSQPFHLVVDRPDLRQRNFPSHRRYRPPVR
ncbi:MAG: hypothetical protein AAF488_16330, partial [Planctomycetota bacterium]